MYWSADSQAHACAAAAQKGSQEETTTALVRELDYYGLLNYVLPRQVEAELTQWSADFADVFSIERYHHKAAQLWLAFVAKEADIAGTLCCSLVESRSSCCTGRVLTTLRTHIESYFRKAIDFDLGTGEDDDKMAEDGSALSKQASYSQAVKYYHKAASLGTTPPPQQQQACALHAHSPFALGHVSALFNLAVCYMDGDGVPANAAKAVRFLLKAAEAGHKQSQYQVRPHPIPHPLKPPDTC